ncbi:MAG: hypothetical protein JXR89_08400 [Deltaproteobacteria bacterium]|nr:hypothetical protein [Deltaproteobacteria bacterium]
MPLADSETSPRIFIITGEIAAGKTTLLQALVTKLRRRFRLCGVLCQTTGRVHRSGRPATSYNFKLIPNESILPWAERRTESFSFNRKNLARAREHLQSARKTEIYLLDDIGPLELEGDGFDDVIATILKKEETGLILAVKKRCLGKVLERYRLSHNCLIYDLGQDRDPNLILQEISRRLEQRDARQIATFAVLAGLAEVGLGSVLHSLKIPLKGHFLALLQLMLLTACGNRLNGRGLYQIATIAALLKSFSPAGPRLKPMFYIFTQGALFALPSSLLNWRLATALIGAALSSTIMLLLALGFAQLQYGQAYFSMLEKALNRLLATIGAGPYGLESYLIALFLLKIGLTAGAVSIAYFSRCSFLEQQLSRLRGQTTPATAPPAMAPSPSGSWPVSARKALRDLVHPRALLPLIITSTAIIYFTQPGTTQSGVLLLRAMIVTWLGFMLIHKLNPLLLVDFLRRRGKHQFAATLNYSLAAWQQHSPSKPKRNT